MTSKNNDRKAEPESAVPEVWEGAAVADQLPRLWSDDQLADMKDVATLEAMVRDSDVGTADISDLGTGFVVLDTKDKGQLVGIEFYIVDWRWNNGDMGEFVSLAVMVRDGRKFIVNDGSSGIRQQMHTVEKKLGGKGVIKVPKGLVKSEYTFVDGNGDEKPAVTYYLSLSK